MKKAGILRTVNILSAGIAMCMSVSLHGCTEVWPESSKPETSSQHGDLPSGEEKMRVLFKAFASSSGNDPEISDGQPSLEASANAKAQENEVRNIVISVYDNGSLVKSIAMDGEMSGEIELDYGRFYRYYATANINPGTVPDTEDEMKQSRINVSTGEPSGGFPMSASGGFTVTGDGITINVILRRLHARIGFSMDLSEVPDLEITSVSIRQAATSVSLFSDSKATSTAGGDTASAAELKALNSGSEIGLYVPENCQGVLLPGNQSSAGKVPENIPGKSSLCTYIEATGKFNGENELKGSVIYRFYLGQNATSDFSVRRNSSSSIRLVPSRDAVTDPTWQVDADVYAEVGAILPGTQGAIYYINGNSCNRVYTDNNMVSWVKIIRGNGLYVAAGNRGFEKYGSIWISGDGISWEMAMNSYSHTITDIAYGNGMFVAVTGSNAVLLSEGGRIWKTQTVSQNMTANTIGFGAGKFVGTTAMNAAFTSSDGIQWTKATGSVLYVSMIEYGENGFIGVGGSGQVALSANGSKWSTSQYIVDGELYSIDDLAFGNGLFVLATETMIYYSTDGISWKSSDIPSSLARHRVDFRDGVFCAASYQNGGGTCISTSLDGIHWRIIWSSTLLILPEDVSIVD